MWLLHSLVPRHSHICCFSTESGESLVQYKGPKFAELQATIHISWKQQIAGEGGGGGGGWAGYEASFYTLCTSTPLCNSHGWTVSDNSSHAHILYLTKMSAEQGSALTTPIMEGSPSL